MSKAKTLPFALLLLVTLNANAQPLVFSAPPVGDRMQAEQLYAPVAQYLSTVLGEPVTYDRPVNWAQYSRNIRQGRYDLILDDAPLVSWRLAHTDQVPIVRLPGELHFKVVSAADNRRIQQFEDLKYYRVCALAAPDLSATVVLVNFDELTSPTIFASMNGRQGVFDDFMAGRCEAAVLRDQDYAALAPNIKARLRVLYESKPIPNKALTAGGRVTPAQREKLVTALSEPHAELSGVLSRFAPGAKALVSTSATDYTGYNRYLQGVVWGW